MHPWSSLDCFFFFFNGDKSLLMRLFGRQPEGNLKFSCFYYFKLKLNCGKLFLHLFKKKKSNKTPEASIQILSTKYLK